MFAQILEATKVRKLRMVCTNLAGLSGTLSYEDASTNDCGREEEPNESDKDRGIVSPCDWLSDLLLFEPKEDHRVFELRFGKRDGAVDGGESGRPSASKSAGNI